MKVHEYQAKELLKKAGVAVPDGIVVTTRRGGRQGVRRAGGGLIVVKAQVHAGGRGKGVAIGPDDDRDAGARDRQRAASRGPSRWPRACSSSSRPRRREKAAASLLGKTLVTYQTGAAGQPDLQGAGHGRARHRPRALPGHGDRPRPAVPGPDGLDRRGRRDRDRRPQDAPRRSSASRSTSASAWPISRPGRSARRSA